ncbi:transglycosylase SLT domain-containing protein [Psittacicella hinzii]|uniref:transglycosylase SLT domain-containing protein n=1 Tax=Psittacicella hinzii TaxID=2028575 RepID=UPI001CA6B127|nr:transglycosylase SLT domain-containing protein [Psittacicella hinzii]
MTSLVFSVQAFASNNQTLKVGMVLTPNYFIKDGETTLGLDYEILENFAKQRNLVLDIKVYPSLSSLAKGLEQNEVAIIGGNLTNHFRFLKKHYQTTPYLVEKLTIIAYEQHSSSTVRYPTHSNNIFQAAGADYSKVLPLKIHETDLNIFGLFKKVANLNKYQTLNVRYIVTSENKARALQQIYPTTKLFNAKDKNGKDVTINDVFFIKNDELRNDFNNFLDNFINTKTFTDIKYNNLNSLKFFNREENRSFVSNMQTKFLQYSPLFRKNATEMDWRLVMAVGYQESRWTPDAVSPWGPSGLMMLTNASAKALGVTNKLDAKQSITEGTKLLMKFRNNLTKEIKGYDRDMFAISNYNQGIAKIIDARTWLRKHGFDPNSWVDLAKHYPDMSNEKHKYGKINGKLASEYIINVRKWHYMIINYTHFYRF